MVVAAHIDGDTYVLTVSFSHDPNDDEQMRTHVSPGPLVLRFDEDELERTGVHTSECDSNSNPSLGLSHRTATNLHGDV